ncbi:DUF4998 domain-containing protein [Rapidithrix thailandica]|uniref:DUF4998 domain-containing protein n=1 Tax=Rapidithrix thailandica TaxID=413964 RepID=A0AAW9RVA6_9BACT
MTKKSIHILLLSGLMLSLGLFSCDKMEDFHSEFLQGGEIIYSEKPDSTYSFPGKDRIKLGWLLVSASRVTQCAVYWNAGENMKMVEVPAGEDSVWVETLLEDMEEKSYIFEIYTLDKDGNRSVKVEEFGVVYGEKYQATLSNRDYLNAKYSLDENRLTIDWFPAEENAVGVEAYYVDKSGTSHELFIPNEKEQTVIENFAFEGEFRYKTLLLPDEKAIDTFYTESQSVKITEIDLKNSNYPIQHGEWDGKRWGMPKDWIVSESAKNQAGYGGFDGTDEGGYFSMEKWTENEEDKIINGKIYQVMTLPPGTYQLKANFSDGEAGFDVKDEAYLVVTPGNNFLNIDDLTPALGYASFNQAEVEFTLEEETEISMGLITTFEQPYQYFRCYSVRLLKTN